MKNTSLVIGVQITAKAGGRHLRYTDAERFGGQLGECAMPKAVTHLLISFQWKATQLLRLPMPKNRNAVLNYTRRHKVRINLKSPKSKLS